jgi:hypothetical protein
MITVSWYNCDSNTHGKITKKVSIRNDDRKQQKLLLMANGITNTKTENIHFNYNNKNPSKNIFSIFRSVLIF